MADEQTERDDGGGVATANETLSVTDNRTGENYDVPIEDGTVKAMDFRQIKVSEDDFGLMTYDPAFTNTASVRSSVCYIDGEAGVLEYRGYPIEELCERSSYLEVAYLLIYGELPTQEQLDEWIFEITHHTFVHENIKKFVEGFRYDAHPMGMLLATVGALSTFYPDASNIDDEMERHMAARPADRQDADARRVRVPAQPRAAVRVSGQRPVLPRQLPLDDVQDDRGQVRAGPAARARPRRPLDPARRPRAELLDERGARGRLVPGGPVLGGRGRRGRAVRPAARRGERAGAAHARAHRLRGQHPGLPRAGEEPRREADGLRAPGLQELRPARPDHQGARGQRLRGHGEEPEARTRHGAREARPRRRVLHRAQALPERRLLLGADLRGAQPAAGHVHGDVRDPADVGLDRPVARDGHRPGDEDRAPAPDLHGRSREAATCRSRSARSSARSPSPRRT